MVKIVILNLDSSVSRAASCTWVLTLCIDDVVKRAKKVLSVSRLLVQRIKLIEELTN